MDTRSLLESLNARECRYLLIGALAFPHYGYARATLDVDIFIDPQRENAARVRLALADFGFDVTEVTVEDLLEFKLLVRDYSLQVDVHPFVTGVEFEPVYASAIETKVQGVPVKIPSLDDVIKMKQAAGRPKDLEDLKFLAELHRRNELEGE
jgi:predicted nucleotidyltransferase